MARRRRTDAISDVRQTGAPTRLARALLADLGPSPRNPIGLVRIGRVPLPPAARGPHLAPGLLPHEQNREVDMNDFAHPEALVDGDWVVEHIDDPRVRIIEVDEDTSAYEKGHIRNAVGWNWTTDLHDPVRRDYVDQEGLSRLLEQAGVASDTTVVLYGGNNNWFAAYAYWLCRYLGFDAVKLLDGGRKRWELDARELTQTVPEFASTDLRVSGLVRGELRALPDEVRALYGGEGIDPDRGVISYCRIGERSAHTWFVLHELLGYPSVENYDGSWTEYGSLVGVPVER